MDAKRIGVWMVCALVCWTAAMPAVGALNVVSVEPAPLELRAPIRSKIAIHFDRPVLPSSVTPLSFGAFGRWSGPCTGNFSFSNGNQTVTLTPDHPLSSGEGVMVVLSRDLQAADGSFLRSAGYSYQFTTRTRPAAMSYAVIATMSNRTEPDIQTRIYGALASDMNRDGYLDLTTVNEVSSDLRVCLNRADGTGLYDPFLEPFPISYEASPNEPADFNRDGLVDVCAAATSTSTVWIVMGNGDGTFMPPGQEQDVGTSPHGIAVLDADGDGDMDIATSNTDSNDVSLLLNNGAGTFGPPVFFEGGGSAEYGLSAADMNNDGIMDLVVGAISSEEIIIHLGNGNGTFSPLTPVDAGGQVWMVVCGDVNGDGNMDVTTANSGSSSGSILLGNGGGGLTLHQVQPTVSHVVATDLSDLDGDGDLDWVLSSFGGRRWRIYRNNGAGTFTYNQEFVAPSNPSCAVLLDFDNDRDVDLALTDELADVIVLQKNSGTAALGDFDNDGDIDLDDFARFFRCFNGLLTVPPAGCSMGDFINADLDGDGDADLTDFGGFQEAFTTP